MSTVLRDSAVWKLLAGIYALLFIAPSIFYLVAFKTRPRHVLLAIALTVIYTWLHVASMRRQYRRKMARAKEYSDVGR